MLAGRYNIDPITMCEWRGRDNIKDASHCLKTLHANLPVALKFLVAELRDDPLRKTDVFICLGLNLRLRRHGFFQPRRTDFPRAFQFLS
jgi:hypothetical protein